MKSAKLLYGTIFTRDYFASVMSIQRNNGFENTRIMPMSGQSANVYIPRTTVGINASSKNPEEAKLFAQTLLGSEVQGLMSMGFPVNKKAFEENLEIEGLNGENAIVLNTATDEELQSIKNSIYKNLDIF